MNAALLAGVLLASVIGSLHCVGMCGGFVAAVASGRRDWSVQLSYQATRGLAYMGLGAIAGLLGAGLDGSAAWTGVQRLAAPLMGLTLIAMAIASVWPSASASEPLIRLGAKQGPGLLARARLHLSKSVRERGAGGAAAAGLLSALLPCGWLWAYVVVAASTGSVGQGIAVMAVFWLGSVPALLGVGLLAGELGRRLGRHVPRVSAGIMLLLGVLSLAGKLGAPPAVDVPPAVDGDAHHAEQDAASLPSEAPCH